MSVFDWPSYKEPIIIFTYARTGSSMIAQLFYLHGVWVGEVYSDNRSAHPNGKFEHKHLGKQDINLTDDVDIVLKNGNYRGGHWLVKRKVSKKKIDRWLTSGFNPYFVLVRRDTESIIASRWRIYNLAKASGTRTRKYPPNEYEGIKEANKLMDYLRDKYKGMDIHSDLLIKGDYSEIKSVFNKIGLQFDPEIADNHIRADLWKRKSYL